MTRHHIEIPESVFEVEVESRLLDQRAWTHEYNVSILAGGVVLFEHTYHDNDDNYDDDHVYSEDEARDRGLALFGRKIKKLLDGDA